MGHVALQTTADTKQNYVRVAWDAGEFPRRADACTELLPAAPNCECAA